MELENELERFLHNDNEIRARLIEREASLSRSRSPPAERLFIEYKKLEKSGESGMMSNLPPGSTPALFNLQKCREGTNSTQNSKKKSPLRPSFRENGPEPGLLSVDSKRSPLKPTFVDYNMNEMSNSQLPASGSRKKKSPLRAAFLDNGPESATQYTRMKIQQNIYTPPQMVDSRSTRKVQFVEQPPLDEEPVIEDMRQYRQQPEYVFDNKENNRSSNMFSSGNTRSTMPGSRYQMSSNFVQNRRY